MTNYSNDELHQAFQDFCRLGLAPAPELLKGADMTMSDADAVMPPPHMGAAPKSPAQPRPHATPKPAPSSKPSTTGSPKSAPPQKSSPSSSPSKGGKGGGY